MVLRVGGWDGNCGVVIGELYYGGEEEEEELLSDNEEEEDYGGGGVGLFCVGDGCFCIGIFL